MRSCLQEKMTFFSQKPLRLSASRQCKPREFSHPTGADGPNLVRVCASDHSCCGFECHNHVVVLGDIFR